MSKCTDYRFIGNWVSIILIGSLFFAAGGLVGSAKAETATIKIAYGEGLVQLDTGISSGNDTTVIALHIWELLFAEDGSLKPSPMLAESYSLSAKNTTYTIQLRRNVLFHNGKEMKAEDVIASLIRWGHMSGITGKPTFKNVSNIEAKDDYTVVINLKEPSGVFLSALSVPSQGAFIMPKSIAEKYDGKPLEEYIGTGPYKLDNFIPGESVYLVPFEKYSARTEPPSGYVGRRTARSALKFTPVIEAASRVTGLLAGDYDIIEWPPKDDFEKLSKNPKVKVIKSHIAPFHARTIFNTKTGPMSDVRLRRAVNYAVPAEDVIAAYGPKKLWDLNPSLMHKGTRWYSDVGMEFLGAHDPEKAKQLMKEAGYKGQTIRFNTTKSPDYYFTLPQVIAYHMEKVGFKVEIEVRDWAGYLDTRNKNPEGWDLTGSGATLRADPSQLPMITSSGYAGFWNPERWSELKNEMNKPPRFEERYKLYEKLQARYWEDLPSLKWGDIWQYRATRKNIKSEGAIEQIFLVLWNTWKE